jgi:hypothetical protein
MAISADKITAPSEAGTLLSSDIDVSSTRPPEKPLDLFGTEKVWMYSVHRKISNFVLFHFT